MFCVFSWHPSLTLCGELSAVFPATSKSSQSSLFKLRLSTRRKQEIARKWCFSHARRGGGGGILPSNRHLLFLFRPRADKQAGGSSKSSRTVLLTSSSDGNNGCAVIVFFSLVYCRTKTPSLDRVNWECAGGTQSADQKVSESTRVRRTKRERERERERERDQVERDQVERGQQGLGAVQRGGRKQ